MSVSVVISRTTRAGYQGVPNIHGLKLLYQILDKRRLSDLAGKNSSSGRRTERDNFRKVLKTKGAISSIDKPESLLVCFYFFLNIYSDNVYFRYGLGIYPRTIIPTWH